MKWKVIRILLLCWLIPLFLFIIVLGVFIGNRHMDTTAENYRQQVEFNNQICVERLNSAVADSRQASYDGEILETWEAYRKGEISYSPAKKAYDGYLNKKYQKSRTISSVILWFQDGDKIQSSSTYSERGNGTYQQIRTYWEKDQEAVAKLAATLDTSVGFLVRDKALYLVRNLVDRNFDVQGVLVFRINSEYCFESIKQYPVQDGIYIRIDEETPLFCSDEEAVVWQERLENLRQSGYAWTGGRLYLDDTVSGDSYQIETAMQIRREITMFPFYGYPYVLAGMLLSMLLMLVAILIVFRREVTRPVETLRNGLQHIEQGELGYQIAVRPHNREFQYLTEAVNRMSQKLEQQILKSYQEEIALKEARIMALQLHINPHFLNNTLEIINWEARLSGNEKVSKMIGSLSVMMDAALDRRKRPQVSLEEEMGYVNSYLYIMKHRLGDRLTVEVSLPKELLSCRVPRLILQPVIENAIEHGVIPNGCGTVKLTGYRDGDSLYLEIQNDAGLSPEDRERIERLLSPDYKTSQISSESLGIANVNQRLRILFGEPCGLAIDERDGQVTARLTIPWNLSEKAE